MNLKRFLILFSLLSAVCSVAVFAAECPDCGSSRYSESYYAGTCRTPERWTYSCRECGFREVEYGNVVNPHSYKETERIEPTPSVSGSVTFVCSVCGEVAYDTLEYISPVPGDTAFLAKTLFSGVWGLFGVYVPGFGFTIGQLWLGVALCSISVGVLRLFLGLGGSGVSSRTGSTNNPKISDNRKGDQY